MHAPTKPLTIGKVARLGGVGIETIRFYEREGLIANPPRKESGYRQYGPETVSRLRFIHRARELGFSLKEIKELLFLRLDPGATCDSILDRAEEKIREIEERIQTLQRMKKALKALARACPGEGPVTKCPILGVADDYYEVVHDSGNRAGRRVDKLSQGKGLRPSVAKTGGVARRQREQ
jgi:MerR family mercuric resistance operon transcriptional regulator